MSILIAGAFAAFVCVSDAAIGAELTEAFFAPPLLGERAGVRAEVSSNRS
jgi:hypothetical protein